jgi:hypothetical protein
MKAIAQKKSCFAAAAAADDEENERMVQGDYLEHTTNWPAAPVRRTYAHFIIFTVRVLTHGIVDRSVFCAHYDFYLM